MELLRARLGKSLVLARPQAGSLHILNASAAELWDCLNDVADGAQEAALQRHLTDFRKLPAETAGDIAASLLSQWRHAGLIGAGPDDPAQLQSSDWLIAADGSARATPGDRVVEMAAARMALRIDDTDLRAAVDPLLPAADALATTPCAHALRLTGGRDNWALHVDGVDDPVATGTTADEAVVCILNTLVDLACRIEDRLLLAHGAGLVSPWGCGILLIAPGGSGKTTLAAALDAEGWRLLSDDVVPVGMDGRLLALRGPLCLKEGAWPILSSRRPDLARASAIARFGEKVRMIAPAGPAPLAPAAAGLMLFPRYQPGVAPAATPLAPEEALRRIVEADAVIRNLTQEKLEALAQWVSAAPAYALDYPDLESGLALVRRLASEAAMIARP